MHRWVVRAKQGSGKINLATVYRRGNKVSWLWWKYTYVKTQTAHLKLLNFTLHKSYINKANWKKKTKKQRTKVKTGMELSIKKIQAGLKKKKNPGYKILDLQSMRLIQQCAEASWLYAFLPNCKFSDITSVVWNQPWWSTCTSEINKCYASRLYPPRAVVQHSPAHHCVISIQGLVWIWH